HSSSSGTQLGARHRCRLEVGCCRHGRRTALTSWASAGPASFSACVRSALSALLGIGGSLVPALGTVCLGRRDSHADQGAAATQFSSSTGTGTSRAIPQQDFGPPARAARKHVEITGKEI